MRSPRAVRAYRLRIITEGHAAGRQQKDIAGELNVARAYVYRLARHLGLSFAERDEKRRQAIRAADNSKREPLPIPRHNTTGYTYWRCRCEECCKAHAAAVRRWKEARKCL